MAWRLLRGKELCEGTGEQCGRRERPKNRVGRCWTCSAWDKEIDLGTWAGRLLARATELDFDSRNGRACPAASLNPLMEAAWRAVVQERIEWENEEQKKAMDAAKHKR